MRRSLALLLFLPACGGLTGNGDFGATPGGVKDMSIARDLVAHGQIPPPEALLVEAMFAEHDLPLDGAPCNQTLCLRAGAGVAPDRAGVPHGWLQVAMSSDVDPDTWQRPPTTFILTVDVSGSMGWPSADPELPSAGFLARTLMHNLVPEMRADDEVAIVTYGDRVATPLDITAGDQQATILGAVDALHEDGSTNMEAGLRRAYQIGADAVARGRGNVRILLFSDEQPNVGATSPDAFGGMVAAGAADGVYITVMGLGLGLDPAQLEAMSHLRGANAFSVTKTDEAAQFVSSEWPWFTTPIAYDLNVAVTPSDGLSFDQAYGFPGSFVDDPELDVATVFLSKHKGALLVSLTEDQAAALDTLTATVDLAYTEAGGAPHIDALHVDRAGAALDDRGQWFGQTSVGTSTALALLVSGMHDAAQQYADNPQAAQDTMQIAADRFDADAAASTDPQLGAEIEFSHALLQLFVDRAPQGTLYGI